MIRLVLPLESTPASRPRFVTRGGFTRTYYAGRYKRFLEKAPQVLIDSLIEQGGIDRVPFTGPVKVCVDFMVRKPRTTKLMFPPGGYR